jgi:hypothetical protein
MGCSRGHFIGPREGCQGDEGGVMAGGMVASMAPSKSFSSRWVKAQHEGGNGQRVKEEGGAGTGRKGDHGGGRMAVRDTDGSASSAGGGTRMGWAVWAEEAKHASWPARLKLKRIFFLNKN